MIRVGKFLALMSLFHLGSSGCATVLVERTAQAYFEQGAQWGQKLRGQNFSHKRKAATNLDPNYIQIVCLSVTQRLLSPDRAQKILRDNNITRNDIDIDFVYALYRDGSLDYFNVHNDLKTALKKGFREGYTERTADLVLGPHLAVAAACIGKRTALDFIDVIETFESEWTRAIRETMNTFIVLISEGSQTDRSRFIKEFVDVYNPKYLDTREKLCRGKQLPLLSEGGTHVGYEDSGALDIPKTNALKVGLYGHVFVVMGDELGRRYSTNLISRSELIDLLRRARPALMEHQDRHQEFLCKFIDSFMKQNPAVEPVVLTRILDEAGYKARADCTRHLRKRQQTARSRCE